MSIDQDVAAGLFDWINSLQVAEEVTAADDLKDGVVIWKVLKQIDRFSFPGDVPETVERDQWAHRWTNLKHIYDALSIFLLEECGQTMPLRAGRPDLKSMAQSASVADTILVLKLVVIAAINCNDRIKYLENMQTLPMSTQEVLMMTAQEADEDVPEALEEEEEDILSDPIASSPRSPRSPMGGAPDIDSDLASEERLGKVIADNQRIAHEKRDLQNQVNDLQDRYAKLYALHERRSEELKDTNDRLTSVLAGTAESSRGKTSDTKQETLMAALEAKVLELEEDSSQLRKANELLRIKADRVQKLQDDLDEAKSERDKLSRRANAAEKYKQKLETVQDVEKDNASLRAKIIELQNQLKQSDSTQVTSSDLLREVDEYRRLLPSIEQERHELNEMKKRLEFDYHVLEARHQDTLEQYAQQQSSMEELQGRLQDYEDGVTPTTPKANGDEGLETLEADFAENERRLTEALIGNNDDEENSISEEELRAIMSAMRSQVGSESNSERVLSRQVEKKLLSAIQRSYDKKQRLQEHIQKQSALISSLQSHDHPPSRPSSPFSRGVVPAPPHIASPVLRPESPVSDPRLHEALALNENLRRELRLMTSAWYEQNTRLMSQGNPMIRGRATAEPRSFLGKQRKAVEKVMLGAVGS